MRWRTGKLSDIILAGADCKSADWGWADCKSERTKGLNLKVWFGGRDPTPALPCKGRGVPGGLRIVLAVRRVPNKWK